MVSVGSLRRAKWSIAFEYDEPAPHRMHFIVWSNAVAPKITMVHIRDTRDGPLAGKTDIQYRAHGRKCSTLADAVRAYNAEEERRERASRGETTYRPKTRGKAARADTLSNR